MLGKRLFKINLLPMVLNQSPPFWSWVSLNWEGGGGGGMEGHMFHLPNLYPLVPTASLLNCSHLLIAFIIYFNVLKFLSLLPGSHYPLFCDLTLNLHSPHSGFTTTPCLLYPSPQHTCHKLKVFFIVAFFSTLYPMQFLTCTKRLATPLYIPAGKGELGHLQ